MQAPQVSVVSIGTMAANPDWGEREPVRTGHATTSLIRTESANILVDPGLPPEAISARLGERANLDPDDVTHVFLTSFHPETRRGLRAFERADWLIGEREREAVGVPMAESLKHALQRGHAEHAEALKEDIAILQRCNAAPDTIVEHVDLFPLPGVTPGLCGLLIADPNRTTLICGDAIPTQHALEHGIVHRGVFDIELARESFTEAIEIADFLVLGRDNWATPPGRRGDQRFGAIG